MSAALSVAPPDSLARDASVRGVRHPAVRAPAAPPPAVAIRDTRVEVVGSMVGRRAQATKRPGGGPPGLDRPDQYRPAPAPSRFMLEPEPAPSERWVLPCMRISFFAARNVPARSASAWHIKAPRLVWPNSRLPGK